jgi:uncharacterized protein HemX
LLVLRTRFLDASARAVSVTSGRSARRMRTGLHQDGLTIGRKFISLEGTEGRTVMRARVAIAIVALALGVAGTAGVTGAEATSDEDSAAAQRHASVLRAKAEALREQANHLRDGEGVTHTNVGKAKELEKEADSLEAQANRIDAQNWPPPSD